MADMVHCRGCGNELHRTALSCPKCGAMQRTRRYKSKVSAGVLALLLGGLGIHRFYLGQWWGVFYLLFCWTYIPAIIAVVEGFVFLLSNQERWDNTHNEGIPSGSSSAAGAVVAVVVGVFLLVIVGGTLAAIAIPAYQDYTMRAQVTEALLVTGELRRSLVEDQGLSRQDLDRASREAVMASRYVADIQVDGGGSVLVTMGKEASALSGQTILFEPVTFDGRLVWQCTGGSLAAKYRPSACR